MKLVKMPSWYLENEMQSDLTVLRRNILRPFWWLAFWFKPTPYLKFRTKKRILLGIVGKHNVSGDCFTSGYMKKYDAVIVAKHWRCLGSHYPIMSKLPTKDKE